MILIQWLILMATDIAIIGFWLFIMLVPLYLAARWLWDRMGNL